MVVEDEAALDSGQCRSSKADRRAVTDYHDVARPVGIVEVTQSQIAEHRQIAVEHIAAALPPGHRDAEFALAPPSINGGKLRDRVVVSAILQITGLHLVYSADFGCGHGELGADLDRSLRRSPGDRV